MEHSFSTFYAINTSKAKKHLKDAFGFEAEVKALDGEEDRNFLITSSQGKFLLKVLNPSKAEGYADFYVKLSKHVHAFDPDTAFQFVIPDLQGNYKGLTEDGYTALLCKWIEGRRWSSVNPISNNLLFKLGEKTAQLNKALQGFEHPWIAAIENFDWDLANAAWTKDYLHLLDDDIQANADYFLHRFETKKPDYDDLRKCLIQNDGNDNNILLSNDLVEPRVEAIIDFGDAVQSQLINNVAITSAYAMMKKPDPLRAAALVIAGHHESFPIKEEELPHLYTLIGMRLVTSLCKSAINKQKEPNNEYLQVSQKDAQELLLKWKKVNPDYAHFTFRKACNYNAHPKLAAFNAFAKKNPCSLQELFKAESLTEVLPIDMSVGSLWLGPRHEFTDDELKSFRLSRLQAQAPEKMIAGGYLENRTFYSTDAYRKEGNNGSEYRSIHLGVDFWRKDGTAIYSLWEGEVFSIFNNDNHKDYGPTLILKHKFDKGAVFYSLYGHLSKETLNIWKKGDQVKKGDLLARFGGYQENGHWTPHLHFQLMLDMLGNEHDFPGVAFPQEIGVWRDLCPDPNLFLQEEQLTQKKRWSEDQILKGRKKHLGRGMSLSYKKPLHIVRGEGAYLIANNGRKYLDTANNVAHCGHEHPRVVRAGQQQMALLNTNTRYLHKGILEFTEELLTTLPPKLSVVHMVNSGSEANELALRMAQTWSGQQDFVAMEVGYHGNTNKTIEVSSYKFDGKGGNGCPATTHLMPLPDAFRGMYRGPDSHKYASHIFKILDQLDSKGIKPAGFICESILSCGGQIELPNNYLKSIYPEIRKRGGLCIADEVQVGLGRVGSHFWGFELQDVVPDIVTIGKPIGNGHPLGVVVCTEEVADAFANGMEYFNTFGGNPVSSAIGLEVLRVIKDEKLQENALRVGKIIKSTLKDFSQNEFPIIADVRGQGLFLGFELADQNRNPLGEKASYLANRMSELDFLISTDGPDHNVIKIKPPMVFSNDHAYQFLHRLRMVLKEDYMRDF
ncbi:MAG: aminotransferase class III-fold pyridoxal phosphate-dependent enzyme [Bacteroidia bacterium]|nr:aminotransferase class III-fold pyridoxal phosphate-dependent enzyme [Bacteroidia bacterium]